MILGTLIVHPNNGEQLTAVKTILRALKVNFEEEENPYDLEFVKTILKAEEDIKNGKRVKILTKDLWK